MIVKPELIKQIRHSFKLNIYETKVWLALLQKGVASAGEIAEISSVPRSRTYDVLESLEKQGFAIMKLGKPVKYLAVNPSVVLEKFKNNVMKEAGERTDELSKIKDTDDFAQLLNLHNTGMDPIQPSEISGMLKGRSNSYTHLKTLIQGAKKEIMLMTTPSALSRKKFLKQTLDRLAKKGIKTKIAVNCNTDELKAFQKEFKSAEVKTVPVSSRFCIVDGNEMLFMLNPSSADEDLDNGVWIKSDFFVNSLTDFFKLAWKNK
ncbi:TrmB family transcriptional regulator [Nanoarchaeota archaeon]